MKDSGHPTLVFDDEEAIRRSIARTLERNGHACVQVADAGQARSALVRQAFDLVMCDPDVAGDPDLGLVRHILEVYPDTAVVIVTGLDDPNVAAVALEAGAYGYIVKPFSPNEILVNATNALIRRRLEIENRSQREEHAELVRQHTEELWTSIGRVETADEDLRKAVIEMVRRLALTAELRDEETSRHIDRMSRYAELLARELGLGSERAGQILLASRLHDAGKIGIPDRVLRKRGKLTPGEIEVMKTHADIGHRLFAGSTTELLVLAADIAWTHHERWDGAGYPRRLSGEAIPLEGRIAAVADVFDALMSERSYKPAFPILKVLEIMREERARAFDPTVLDAFLNVIDEAVAISREFGD